MECFGHKCLCENMCVLHGDCIINHPLFSECKTAAHNQIKFVNAVDRAKKIIELLQKLQPPKVSGAQIERYFWLIRNRGINLDRGRVPKKWLEFHAKFKKSDTNKKRKSIKLRLDSVYQNREEKRSAKVVVMKSYPQNLDDMVRRQLAEPQQNVHE